jgi:hypothetical protein
MGSGARRTMTAVATIARRHRLADRGLDFYETPAVATQALLRCESLPRLIWEPAAGNHAIADVLRSEGHDLICSDIVERATALDFVADFLTITEAPKYATTIVTNPPFRIANQFVEHALALCPTVVVLARLAFLESRARRDLMRALARVHVFENRLPMMHRDGWGGPKSGSAISYAWFRFERGHLGPALLDRIQWVPSLLNQIEWSPR